MSDILSKPWSLLSIPIVWLTASYPAGVKISTLRNFTKGFSYDPVQPRDNLERFSATEGIPEELSARIRRMEGAHVNGHENLPLWIGAVLAGNYAGLEQSTLNKVAIFYILSRCLYNYIYINHTTVFQSRLRTAIWTIGFLAPMYLLVISWAEVYAAAS